MDRAELEQHNQRVIEEFRRRGGAVGGMYEDMTLLLLHTVGAKSGKPRINPLACRPLGDGRYAVFAANGGAPNRPDWYYNLVHETRVIVEVAGAEHTMVARIATGDERARIWKRQTELAPHFQELAAGSRREIPVIVIEPITANQHTPTRTATS